MNRQTTYDLSSSFSNDNILISILSADCYYRFDLYLQNQPGLPILLIMIILGSVWINFSFPKLMNANLFFLSYLVVSSIQMGANIDYAIVITSRYSELKKKMPIHEAMIEALNQSFPTIVTSGTMLASAGILIGFLSSDPAISSIGVCLGRGTLISILLVMGVLPQTLMLGDQLIERTAFTLKKRYLPQASSGEMKVNGHFKGYVNGQINADISGTIDGTIQGLIQNEP